MPVTLIFYRIKSIINKTLLFCFLLLLSGSETFNNTTVEPIPAPGAVVIIIIPMMQQQSDSDSADSNTGNVLISSVHID